MNLKIGILGALVLLLFFSTVDVADAAYFDNNAIVIFYEKHTGDITGLLWLGPIPYEEAAKIGLEEGCSPAESYELLENYPEEIVRDIVEDYREYIYDIREGRIRKRSPEEILDYFKRYETTPENCIRAIISWGDYEIRVETSSTMLWIKFDSARRQLITEVSGVDGTRGVCNVLIPKRMTTPSDVQVYLDNQPINFSIMEQADTYSLRIEYTHSTHILTVNLASLHVWYTQPLNLALITLAIVAVLGVVYWLRFRG